MLLRQWALQPLEARTGYVDPMCTRLAINHLVNPEQEVVIAETSLQATVVLQTRPPFPHQI